MSEGSSENLVFVSYRRADSNLASGWLYETLTAAYGERCVFMDRDSIREGDDWPQKIEEALDRATALIALIGKRWLKEQDENGRRRLDCPGDWVTEEIASALDRRLFVLPVLVGGVQMPSSRALPESIQALPNRQAVHVGRETFAKDRVAIFKALESVGFERAQAEIEYPIPAIRPTPLNKTEQEHARERLPHWTLRDGSSRSLPDSNTNEFYRKYAFESFEDVIHFMSSAAREIRKFGHHPDWRNVYRDLEVRLTTWDIGDKVTELDVKLALRLDRLYNRYQE